MPSGAGASGRTDTAYGMHKPVLLLGRPVDSRLPAPVPQVQVGFEPESVCATHCPKIHAPTITTKESVAWKKEKKQGRRMIIRYKYFLTKSTPFIFSDINPFFSNRENGP
jgi:hypothetical protein